MVVRRSLPMILAVVIQAILMVGAGSASVRAPRDKPNFIMLFVDDLGYGDVGFTGHPTTRTPNIDRLAAGGKVLTTWYSGCPVCTGSRGALMTGRQFNRVGVAPVFNHTTAAGLPLNETTIAEMLKKQNYTTGMMGKWHLGQRQVYLPGNRGFDHYLGIPFSDDMGMARATKCPPSAAKDSLAEGNTEPEEGSYCGKLTGKTDDDATAASRYPWWSKELADVHNRYRELGYQATEHDRSDVSEDPGAKFLPLVYQEHGSFKVLEQPLDFTTLAEKYNKFVVDFVHTHKDSPFFLYVAFSHVHATATNQPCRQYAGCAFQSKTSRGPFGDALMEADWITGNVHKAVVDAGIEENTLILFTSDNGPWLIRKLSGGSAGLFTGAFGGYWDTGKGSTWEGGIREPAFAYWKGQISPGSRSEAVVSSLDVLPTFVALANGSLTPGRVYDGHDMIDVLLKDDGKSKHEVLFFYGGCRKHLVGPSAARFGDWKAHWCTSPGHARQGPSKIYDEVPLLFNINADPSEAEPLNPDGKMPTRQDAQAAVKEFQKAHALEKKTFVYGKIIPEPDGPGEGPDRYAVCCDRAKQCDCDGPASSAAAPSESVYFV